MWQSPKKQSLRHLESLLSSYEILLIDFYWSTNLGDVNTSNWWTTLFFPWHTQCFIGNQKLFESHRKISSVLLNQVNNLFFFASSSSQNHRFFLCQLWEREHQAYYLVTCVIVLSLLDNSWSTWLVWIICALASLQAWLHGVGNVPHQTWRLSTVIQSPPW